jgi:hypothetical protein
MSSNREIIHKQCPGMDVERNDNRFNPYQNLTEVSFITKKIIMFLGSRVRPVHRADNLVTIYKPFV